MKRHTPRTSRPTPRLWVGARVPLPPSVADERGGRAEVVMWMDVSADRVLDTRVTSRQKLREEATASLRMLLGDVKELHTRRPSAFRVSDPLLAEIVAEVIGDEIPVTIGPVPELDAFLTHVADRLRAPEPSYLERASASDMERFFQAAARFRRAQPWRIVRGQHQLIELAVPDMEIVGAAASVSSCGPESCGFLVLESAADYDRFLQLAERGEAPREGLGAPMLAVNFERGAELPDRMRREVATHSWEVASADAFPVPGRIDAEGWPLPLDPTTLVLLTAYTEALACFLEEHPAIFGEVDPAPLHESYSIEDLEFARLVEVTAPHPVAHWSEAAPPRA